MATRAELATQLGNAERRIAVANSALLAAAEERGGLAYIGDDLMMSSVSAAYSLTFRSGGTSARKSSRSERWAIFDFDNGGIQAPGA